MKIKKWVSTGIILASVVGVLAACGDGEASGSSDGANAGVQVVKVAYDQAGKPMTYLDEKGNATGYDVEVMKLVDDLLEDYEFEYVGTTNDDLLIGVEQGKYHVGVKNAFWTEERTQKYIFPEEFLGLSSAGLVLKTENAKIKNLNDFATAGLALAPIAANNAQYTVIAEHNEANPSNPVKLVAGEEFGVDVVQWVNEGRVDGGVMIEGSFNGKVTDPSGPYYHLKDEVVYNEFAVIKTWPLFNKKEQEFADAYDEAIKQLKETDELRKLSEQFYGKDLFDVLDKVER